MEQGNVEDHNNIKNIHSLIENIENIKKLKHPNLLDYIAVWYDENNNKVVIITELLQGGNLHEYRKYQKKLKVKLVKKWIKQILTALDYLHSNNYIHHDIKSQNILIDRISGNLKLGDLIFAEKMGEKGFFTKNVGTEEFMAPEIKEGKYTFKADIYSLGLTIIQFITKEKPYKEYSRKKMLYEAKKNSVLPLALNDIKNEEIKNFISLCLKEEKDRPTSKELLNNKWLNDKDSSDKNSFVEILNEDINLDKNRSCMILKRNSIYKDKSEFISNNSLNKMNSNKTFTIIPKDIYSLEITKLYNKGSDKITTNNCDNGYKYKSFRSFKPDQKESQKEIQSLFSIRNSDETKDMEIRNIFSDSSNKYIDHILSDDNIFVDELKKSDLIVIYLYFIEKDEKIFCIFEDKEKRYENTLFNIKIISQNSKNKKQNKIDIINEIEIQNDIVENENLNIIIKQLEHFITLNENDIELIKKKLEGKIAKLLKENKIRKLKEKINKIIINFYFLINNNEFDYLECLINSNDFNRTKLPREIDDKLKFYQEKKINIENIFSLRNINSNDIFVIINNSKDYLTINLS